MRSKQSNKKLGSDYNQQLYVETSRRRPSYKLKRDEEVDLIQHSRKALARSELIEQSIDITINLLDRAKNTWKMTGNSLLIQKQTVVKIQILLNAAISTD